MARPATAQIVRRRRRDGSVTFRLRVRMGGADASVSLGNSHDGWDEARVEEARRQLLAKIELGLWSPQAATTESRDKSEEPSFRQIASDWLFARELNPAIRERTIELNTSQLKRYLLPFFGQLRPSEITPASVKAYRERIHNENAAIRSAEAKGRPLRDPNTGLRVRTLSNESINKTLQVLAMILDEAEDVGWVDRNVARGRRMREPRERRRSRGALDVDEFQTMLDAANEVDWRHTPGTLEKAAVVRELRDRRGLEWRAIAQELGIATSTAFYLYSCESEDSPSPGHRRAVIATLGLTGLRVSELCGLDYQDISLGKGRIYVKDAKTEAGVRTIDIQPALLDELSTYYASHPAKTAQSPAFPTRTGHRRDGANVLARVVQPVLARANELRAARGEAPVRVHVTPHTFRRTFATLLIAAGLDLPYVQGQLGHADPTTTLSIYTQVIARRDRDQLREEVRALLGLTENAPPQPGARSSRQIGMGGAAIQPQTPQKAPKGPKLVP